MLNSRILLFATVWRIAANRCFHGWPVFWQFPWRRKCGLLLIWAILCWRRCQLAFVSRFFFLFMWFWFALLSYICWLCHSSPSGHLLSAWLCIEEGSSFLAGGRHVIVICTSVSLVSHMYLSVLINSNGVSLLAECWTKRCRPLSSAAVRSPI